VKSEQQPSRIVCLSNVYDHQYHELRGEEISRCLSSPKRRDLFRCLELATGREVIVLSSPPKALNRRHGKRLPAVETHFSTHRQFFCANWDAPKLRIVISWFMYALHVLRHTQTGDIVLIDNYELIYILAAYFTRIFRRVDFVLDYEDGKHLIDRSWSALLSRPAEWMGCRLVRAAILAHPSLGKRLPAGVPTVLVPGFILKRGNATKTSGNGPINFLYSGSLDSTRGVDLLLETLPLLPLTGWHLHISGAGVLKTLVENVARDEKWNSHVTFHGSLPGEAYADLIQRCHVGINCQRVSDPISSVTFPSKIFSYLSAGLLVLSSHASGVPEICGGACIYFDEETPVSLAEAMQRIVEDHGELLRHKAGDLLATKYGIDGTAQRLKKLLSTVVASGC